MKITRLDTIRIGSLPNLLLVEVGTDEGIVGTGDTFWGAAAVEAYLHESVAPRLLGKDPSTIREFARQFSAGLGHAGPGVETRGNSAVDTALWDIAGQVAGMPLYQLLGGSSRSSVRIYNTCAGYGFNRSTPTLSVANWGLPAADAQGPYEDLEGFLHRPEELAESLLGEGITAMKIWPFDPYAEATLGHGISASDLDRGLEPVRRIREAVGNKMDVMIEFHNLWDLPTARRIARALEQYDPYWFEDPVPTADPEVLARFASSTTVPLVASETLAGMPAFLGMLRLGVPQIVMLDVGWAGGVTAALDVAALAQAHQLPVTLHDCTGPVVWTASAHLSLHLPNAAILESVRAYYSSWYADLVTALPRIESGYATPPVGPGLGLALQPDVRKRSDSTVRSSTLSPPRRDRR